MEDDKEIAIQKPSLAAELIIPVGGTIYAIYYISSIWEHSARAQLSGRVLAGLLIFLCCIYIVKVTVKAFNNQYSLKIGDTFGPKETALKRFTFFALILIYIATVNWGGFTLTTFSFIFLSLMVLGIKPISKAITISAVAAISGWIFFIVLLGTRFPMGPFEKLVARIF